MYFVSGESYRLVDEEIKKIVKNETNVITIDLNQSSLVDVIQEATYVSMFQEKKFLIVKNASFFSAGKGKDEDLEILFKYMENPIKLSVIIFVSYEKADARKKIYKEFSKKYKIILVNNLSANDLAIKIRDICFQNKFKINDETISYILRVVGSNFDFIYNELNKIFLYYQEPQKIELTDVKEIVSKTLFDNNFKFIEAVVNKNVNLSLKILEDLYALKVDPIALIMLLVREYRLMLSVYLLAQKGIRKNEIGKQLGLQDWQIDKLEKANRNYYEDDLKNHLKKLATIDYKIKSGTGEKFLELKTFLLEIF